MYSDNCWLCCPQRQDMDEASTREERTFRMWLNSLLPRDRHISSDLGNDLRDGFALLSALDAVLPNSVDVRPAHTLRSCCFSTLCLRPPCGPCRS